MSIASLLLFIPLPVLWTRKVVAWATQRRQLLHCMPRAKREEIRPHQGNNAPGFLALKPGLGFVGLPLDSGRYQTPLFLMSLSVLGSLLDPDSSHSDAVRQCGCSVETDCQMAAMLSREATLSANRRTVWNISWTFAIWRDFKLWCRMSSVLFLAANYELFMNPFFALFVSYSLSFIRCIEL
jgi:hypothetical protein